MDLVELVVKVPKAYLDDAEDFGMLDPETIAQVLREELDERIMRFVDAEVKAHRSEQRASREINPLRIVRIVFDTNVVVSGLLWSGAPHQALRFAAGKRIAAITSEALVDELRDVLNRQKLRRFLERIQKSADELVEDYLAYTAIIEPFPVLDDAVSDIDDLIVLEAAVGGGANCVVTGDDDLLRIGSYAEIAILPVQALVQRIEDDDLSQALGE